MPVHTVEMNTRELLMLMEVAKRIAGDGSFPFGERQTAAALWRKANNELAYPSRDVVVV